MRNELVKSGKVIKKESFQAHLDHNKKVQVSYSSNIYIIRSVKFLSALLVCALTFLHSLY